MNGTQAHILVGYDGSQGSAAALRWAVDEARLRGLAITVCHVWHWPYQADPAGQSARAAVRAMAEEIAAAGAGVVAARAPRQAVRGCAVSGPTVEMLLALSRDAEAVVVGSRGAGGFAELPVGSVAGQVAAHADRPVIVVREPVAREPVVREPAGGDGIVVGVDGSAVSDAVLAFGLEEAALRRLPLTAVCSWWDAGIVPMKPVIDAEVVRRKAAIRFERIITPWREKYPYVPVRTAFVAEPPRVALLAASERARLLVVGRHGHGDAPGPLGSVGRSLVDRASCPVALVGRP
jgi:nucleotide-binding universal stress UspA family protein